MTKSAVRHLFDAAWAVLLTGGCLGGLTFLVLATTLDRVEVCAEKVKRLE